MASSKHSEKIGKQCADNFILRSEFLEPIINVNEKIPFWDGDINVFNNSNQKNKNFVGRVPIQVKTNKVRKIKKNYSKFKFKKHELQSYLRDGGVVIIKIEYINIDSYKFYCKLLLPADLKELIDKNESVILKALNDVQEFERICDQFLLHKPLQSQIDFNSVKKIDENSEYVITNIMDTKQPQTFFSEEQYLYIKNNTDTLSYVSKIKIATLISNINLFKVHIDDNVFFDSCKIKHEENNKSLILSKNIVLDLKYGKLNINSNTDISVMNRYKELNFLKYLYERSEHSFYINDSIVLVSIDDGFNEVQLIIEEFNQLKEAIEILEYFNIDASNISLSQLIKDYNKLMFLSDHIINKKPILNKNNQNPNKIQNINLFNICIVFLELEYTNVDGTLCYFIEDDSLDNMIYISNEFNNFLTSKYFLLNYHYLSKMIINIKSIIRNIKCIDFRKNSCYINNFLLECLKAYDISNNQSLLELSKELIDLLENKEYDLYNHEIFTINKYQTIKRITDLTRREKDELVKLKLNSNKLLIKCSACLLLNQKDDFRFHFDKLSTEEKKHFEDWPIYFFYKENDD